ncbi:MAG: PcfB family protein [Defluviitaleaceae bacterium]|nr:PcfB family protein [Defluviitaleaceae bacterium]
MQEDIEQRTVAIAASAAKLTGRVLAKACMMVLEKIQEEYSKSQAPHGKQSVKKLMNHGVATNSISLDGGKRETELFDRMARKYNVDYAFHKTEPGKYLLFFKANQADAITACFSEYSKCVMAQGKRRPSILQQLQKFAERITSRVQEPKQRDRAKEAVHDER